MTIHASALVDPNACVHESVVIGPFCVVGPNVTIGARSVLHSHCVVDGHTTLGTDNEVFPFASIGKAPQDLKYKGEPTTLQIGNGNKIREGATMQPGTVQGGSTTIVGNNNLFMAYTHVAHDCIVGNNNIIANGVQLSGHVTLGDFVTIGGLVGIHQFCRVGDYSMTAGGSMIVEDVSPFCVVQGDRASLRGLNVFGLKRRGFTKEQIVILKQCYKTIFLSGAATVTDALLRCEALGFQNEPCALQLMTFVKSAPRGVTRPDLGNSHDAENQI